MQDLSTRANDIEKRVGKDHLAAVKVRIRMEDIRQAIAVEQKRIPESFEQGLRACTCTDMTKLSADNRARDGPEGASGNAQAQMRELESAADTLRSLYNRGMQQLSEMNRVEAQPSVTPDARVLMRAVPPLQTESSKKRLLILAGGSMMGLLLGGAFVLLKELSVWRFQNIPAGN